MDAPRSEFDIGGMGIQNIKGLPFAIHRMWCNSLMFNE
jgi:hypothetical protein